MFDFELLTTEAVIPASLRPLKSKESVKFFAKALLMGTIELNIGIIPPMKRADATEFREG